MYIVLCVVINDFHRPSLYARDIHYIVWQRRESFCARTAAQRMFFFSTYLPPSLDSCRSTRRGKKTVTTDENKNHTDSFHAAEICSLLSTISPGELSLTPSVTLSPPSDFFSLYILYCIVARV